MDMERRGHAKETGREGGARDGGRGPGEKEDCTLSLFTGGDLVGRCPRFLEQAGFVRLNLKRVTERHNI